ncbi:hypothetical protein SAMN02745831_01425 [Streptomyces sp. PgraA7]|nr:hypothetical protein SAMN02745831_01425 [Streptomyces sp. PgraA7]
MTTRKSHGVRAALMPYARLPRAHHSLHVLTSTVDVFGATHWLLGEHAPQPGGDVPPFDALVVSVHPGGSIERTELSAVRAHRPHLDRLPDGGFVVAASRARRYEDANQVQVFGAHGREILSFSVGDAIEHLLVDEAGQIWVGHFDENPIGIRRWSATGRPTWMSDDAHIPGLFDCYALNVSGTAAWACPYDDGSSAEAAGSTSRPNRSPNGASSTSAADSGQGKDRSAPVGSRRPHASTAHGPSGRRPLPRPASSCPLPATPRAHGSTAGSRRGAGASAGARRAGR